MITLQQEESIAKMLSELSPAEYASLMAKVDRTKWEVIPQNYYYTRRERK